MPVAQGVYWSEKSGNSAASAGNRQSESTEKIRKFCKNPELFASYQTSEA